MFKNSNWITTFPYGITIEGSPEDLTNFYKLVLTKISTKDLVELYFKASMLFPIEALKLIINNYIIYFL